MASPNEQVLAQLKDIHLPPPVGWWPLATGWYILSVLIILLTGTAVYLAWRRYVSTLSKRQALRLIKSYQAQFQQDQNSQLASARVSELLKRVALVYFPRAKVAGLSGDDWVHFLDETGGKSAFKTLRFELIELPYARSTSDLSTKGDLEALFNTAKNWIEQRRKRCLS